jgi:indolepyruvate ferredoxin oxidoreductase beta subunit
MPKGLSDWIEATPPVRAMLVRRIGNGQRLRPHTVRGQLMLQGLAALRRWRRRSQRHGVEMAHIARWLEAVKNLMGGDYLLGLELIRCRRLVKGYSDTHARGEAKFDKLLRAAVLLQGRPDAAADLAALRTAALADPQGGQLAQRWELLGLGAVAASS